MPETFMIGYMGDIRVPNRRGQGHQGICLVTGSVLRGGIPVQSQPSKAKFVRVQKIDVGLGGADFCFYSTAVLGG